jgi:hypothetical protein
MKVAGHLCIGKQRNSFDQAGRVKTAQRRRAVLTRPSRSRTIECRCDAASPVQDAERALNAAQVSSIGLAPSNGRIGVCARNRINSSGVSGSGRRALPTCAMKAKSFKVPSRLRFLVRPNAISDRHHRALLQCGINSRMVGPRITLLPLRRPSGPRSSITTGTTAMGCAKSPFARRSDWPMRGSKTRRSRSLVLGKCRSASACAMP